MPNNLLQNKNRIAWIDTAKGITAVLVVLGHILNHGVVQAVIYTFHVPVFFLLSGIGFNERENLKQFLIKKIRTLLLPYYIWGAIAVTIYLLAGHLITDKEILTLKECLIGLLWGNAKTQYMQFNLHLWFLPALFAMELVFYLMVRICSKTLQTKLSPLILTAVSVAGSALFYYTMPDAILPFGLETAIKLLPFFSFGYMLRHSKLYSNSVGQSIKQKLCLGAVSLLSLIMLMLSALKHYQIKPVKINYFRDAFGNVPLFICAAISGIVLTISVSIILSDFKPLNFIGRKSLPLLLYQKFPILLFSDLIPYTSKYISSNNFFAVCLSAAVVILLCLVADCVILKFMPFLYGKQYKK